MNTVRSTALCAVAASFALLFSSAAQGAVVAFTTPQAITGDSDVSTVGTLVSAYDFTDTTSLDSDPSLVTVNGVFFQAFTQGDNVASTVGNTTLAGAALTGNNGAFTAAGGNLVTFSLPYQRLLQSAVYSASPGSPLALTLSGLTVGQTYAAQIFVNDPRECCVDRAETVSSGGGNTVTLGYSSTDTIGTAGEFTIGTFTADSATQVITLSAFQVVQVPSSQINGFQLRAVPEPATASLLSLTAAGLLLRRRRA